MDNKKITLKQTVTDKDGNQQIKTISTYTDEAILASETNINEKISNIGTNVETNTSKISNLETNVETNTSKISNLETNVENNTSKISNLETNVENNTSKISANTAEIENLKASVNTGTFDPTSDNPAGQKSTAGAMVSKEEYYSTYALWRFSGMYLQYTEYEIGINNFLNASKIDGMFSDASVGPVDPGQPDSKYMTIPSFKNRIISANFAFSFSGLSYVSFKSNAFLGHNIFNHSHMKSLSVLDGEEVKLFGNCDCCFFSCTNLSEIGAFDLSEATSLNGAFSSIPYLKKIHCKNFPVSFDISYSSYNNTFKESALVEIIGNLVDLTGKTAQTLTMGATYLAKLTDEEKKVATDKNWILA